MRLLDAQLRREIFGALRRVAVAGQGGKEVIGALQIAACLQRVGLVILSVPQVGLALHRLIRAAEVIAQEHEQVDGGLVIALLLEGDGAVVDLPAQVVEAVLGVVDGDGRLIGKERLVIAGVCLGVAPQAILAAKGCVLKVPDGFKRSAASAKRPSSARTWAWQYW